MSKGEHCLRDDEIIQLVRAQIAPDRQAKMEAHLTDCQDCQQRLETTTGRVDSNVISRVTSQALEQTIRRLLETPPATSRMSSTSGPDSLLTQYRFLRPASESEFRACFGKYGIKQLIGQGGMGAVFAGRDRTLQRDVAIKIPFASNGSDDQTCERFLREARAIASIKHENIVTIYSVEEAEGLPFLTMELVEGQSLVELINERTTLPVRLVLRLARDAASGLNAAHSQGIIHRDLKPANILREKETGRFKLTDFGLARSTLDPSLTATGVLAGTPEYMSPEQVNQRQTDQRSDLFNLGIVLYQCCTGISPFHAETVLGTLQRITDHSPVPLIQLEPKTPSWFSALVMALLRKNPDERPRTAEVVLSTIKEQGAVQRHRDKSTQGIPQPNQKQAAASKTSHRRSVAQRFVHSTNVFGNWNRRTAILISGVIVSIAILLAVVVRQWPTDDNKEYVAPDSFPATPTRPVIGFFVDGYTDPIASLEEAIQKLDQGGSVSVHGDGPFFVDSIVLPNQPVSIIAAEGSLPVFLPKADRDSFDTALLTGSSDLHVQGIEIRWPTPGLTLKEEPAPVILMQSGSLEIDHCRIQTTEPGCCLRLGVDSAKLTNSHLIAEQGQCVEWTTDGRSLEAVNCVFESGQTGIVVDGESQVVLSRCHFVGTIAVLAYLGPQQFKQITVANSVLDTDRVLFLTAESQAITIDIPLQRRLMMASRMVKWKDQHNAYREETIYLSRGLLEQQTLEPMVSSLVDWLSLWQASSSSKECVFSRHPVATAKSESPFARVRVPETDLGQPVGADLSQVGPVRVANAPSI